MISDRDIRDDTLEFHLVREYVLPIFIKIYSLDKNRGKVFAAHFKYILLKMLQGINICEI